MEERPAPGTFKEFTSQSNFATNPITYVVGVVILAALNAFFENNQQISDFIKGIRITRDLASPLVYVGLTAYILNRTWIISKSLEYDAPVDWLIAQLRLMLVAGIALNGLGFASDTAISDIFSRIKAGFGFAGAPAISQPNFAEHLLAAVMFMIAFGFVAMRVSGRVDNEKVLGATDRVQRLALRLVFVPPPVKRRRQPVPRPPEENQTPILEPTPVRKCEEVLELLIAAHWFRKSSDDMESRPDRCLWLGTDSRGSTTLASLSIDPDNNETQIKAECQQTFGIVPKKILRLRVSASMPTSEDFQEFSYDNLIRALIDSRDYFTYLKKEWNSTKFADAPALSRVFVAPNVLRVSYAGMGPNSLSISEVWEGFLRQENPPPLVLLGEYGFGKTSSALTFASAIATDWEAGKSDAQFPILMNLRGIAPGHLNPIQLIASWSADKNINYRALLSLIRQGRAVIICDAFDEMPIAHSRDARKKNITALLNLYRSLGARLVLTGRANAFNGYQDLLFNVGHRIGEIQSPDAATVYTLERFNVEQINRYCKYCGLGTASTDSFISSVQSSVVLGDVLTRPVLLAYAVALLKHGSLDLKNIINSADLLCKFLDLLSSIHEEKKTSYPVHAHVEDFLYKSEREFFTLAVSAEMASLERNFITRSEVESLVDRAAQLVPADIGSADLYIPLSQRMEALANPIFEVTSDVLQRGVLALFEPREDCFSFGHKSFFDYYRALLYSELTAPVPSERALAIAKATQVTPELLTSDDEALRFVVEIEQILSQGSLDMIARRLLQRELGGRFFNIQRLLVVNSVIWLGERRLFEVPDEFAFIRSPLYMVSVLALTAVLISTYGSEMLKPTSVVTLLLICYSGALAGGTLIANSQRRVQRWVRLCDIGGVLPGARASALGLRYFGAYGAMKLGLRLGIGGYRKGGWTS